MRAWVIMQSPNIGSPALPMCCSVQRRHLIRCISMNGERVNGQRPAAAAGGWLPCLPLGLLLLPAAARGKGVIISTDRGHGTVTGRDAR